MKTSAKLFVAASLIAGFAFAQSPADQPAAGAEKGLEPQGTDAVQGTDSHTGEGLGAISSKKPMKKMAPLKKDLKKEKRGPIKAPPAENGNIED